MALLFPAVAVESGTVLVLITLVVLPIAAISFARSGSAWKGIGKGRFAIEQELPPRPTESEPDEAELRSEARRLAVARNERRLRRGQPPLDVDAETERQLADFLVGSS